MSSEFFRIDEHVVEASHIRGFPRATSTTQEEVLHLSLKQYTPLDNPHPKPGDLTLIAAHANAFPKVHKILLYLLWATPAVCIQKIRLS